MCNDASQVFIRQLNHTHTLIEHIKKSIITIYEILWHTVLYLPQDRNLVTGGSKITLVEIEHGKKNLGIAQLSFNCEC